MANERQQSAAMGISILFGIGALIGFSVVAALQTISPEKEKIKTASQLKKEMKAAVAQERYEDAAILRDQLKQI